MSGIIMVIKSQSEKAKKFLELHYGNKLLLLPNIWDPIGARILENKGYPAVATASAAISSSLGYDDGEKIKLSTHTEIIKRIVKSVDVPVSADIESGYSSSISELKDTIKQIINTGIVGINIEDSFENEKVLRPQDEQCERIAAIREVAEGMGLHLLINARIDFFLINQANSKDEIIEENIKRAQAYINAGADCVYPIGITDLKTLLILRKEINSPINVLGSGNSESLKTFHKAGFNRVSFGPFIFRSCMKKFVQIIDELYELGSNECFSKDILTHNDISKYLRNGSE